MPLRFDGRNVFRGAVMAFGLSIDDAHIATKAGGVVVPRFFIKGWLVKPDHRLYREDSDLAEMAAVGLLRGILMAEEKAVTLEVENASASDLVQTVANIIGYDKERVDALALLGSKSIFGGQDPKDLVPRDYLDALLEGLVSHIKYKRKLPETS